jgi:hypothetical protein
VRTLGKGQEDAAVAHIRDLVQAHFREAENSTKALTDEIESSVDDPRQRKLL